MTTPACAPTPPGGGNAGTGETGSAYGGGLSGVASTLSIVGGQIYSNGAFGGHTDVLIGGYAYGGGVYVTGPGTTLDIDGTAFYQNIAYGGTGGDIDEEGPATGGSATGGALCIQGIHQADIRDSVFVYNHALGPTAPSTAALPWAAAWPSSCPRSP